MYYTENNIFEDSTVNAVLDRLYYETQKALPDVNAPNDILLSGRAAGLLHGNKPDTCNNVILITADPAIFSFIQNTFPDSIEKRGVARFTDRTIFYLEGLILEVWLSPEALVKIRLQGIVCQELSTINPIFM